MASQLSIPLRSVQRQFSIGSLFAGIGGLEWGLEEAAEAEGLRAGTSWQVERAPYSAAVLAANWPRVARFEDVRTVSRRDLPRVHCLGGGSPCQEISKAAYRWDRKGMVGPRSGLWGQFARLIEELEPDLVVWENVGGALCPIRVKGAVVSPAPVATVLADLDQRGYDAWWTTLLAAAVGAKHLRLRLFVVAWRRAGPASLGEVEASSHALRLDLGSSAWPAGPCERVRRGEPTREIRSSAEVPYHMERIEAGGNAVVPQCGFAVGTAAVAIHRWMRGEGPPRKAPMSRRAAPRNARDQGAALAEEAIRLVLGVGASRPFGHLSEVEKAVRASRSTKRARGVHPLASTWPGIGMMRAGELVVPDDAPVAGAGLACALREACDGADPVAVDALCLWPTATARDWRSGKASEATRMRNARPLSEVAAPGGFLNPDWVDLHMGFPVGYTRLHDPPFPPRRRGSKAG